MIFNESNFSEQEQNTAKLIINTFYKVSDGYGASAAAIAKYLEEQFGNVWRVRVLKSKAEEILRRSASLGFLGRRGDRYVANLARVMCRRRYRGRAPRRSRRSRKRRNYR